jgi:hypothetical protein
MTLQLASLLETVNRNSYKRRLTGAGVLAKAFDTVSFEGLLYKLTDQNFAPCHVLIPWLPNFANDLPVSHIHVSWHAVGGPGWTRFPCDFQSVNGRHTYTTPPRGASAARRRHGFRCYVPRSMAFRRLSQQTGELAQGLEDHHPRLNDHRCALW